MTSVFTQKFSPRSKWNRPGLGQSSEIKSPESFQHLQYFAHDRELVLGLGLDVDLGLPTRRLPGWSCSIKDPAPIQLPVTTTRHRTSGTQPDTAEPRPQAQTAPAFPGLSAEALLQPGMAVGRPLSFPRCSGLTFTALSLLDPLVSSQQAGLTSRAAGQSRERIPQGAHGLIN